MSDRLRDKWLKKPRAEREHFMRNHGECCGYVPPGPDRCGAKPIQRRSDHECTKRKGHKGKQHYDAVNSTIFTDIRAPTPETAPKGEDDGR